jgi:ubiquitin C-terminal hydrolase
MFNVELDRAMNLKAVASNEVYDKSQRSSSKITLSSCFEAFEKEELLTDNDQWYCNKCQEHRDIHKKLELFKVPKILII